LKYVAGEQCIKIHDRLNEITAGTQFGFQPWQLRAQLMTWYSFTSNSACFTCFEIQTCTEFWCVTILVNVHLERNRRKRIIWEDNIKVEHKEAFWGWEVGETVSGSCLLMGFKVTVLAEPVNIFFPV
jgi:hypothetical protein